MNKILKRISSFLLAIVMCLGITAVVNTVAVEYTVADAAVGSYYSGITAAGGKQLLGQLHDLITSTHKKYTSYSDCSNPTYVQKTDPGSSSSYVKEFYSQEDISASWGSGKVGTWNREHVWCQSLSNNMWGETGGGADMHHIRPAESQVNSIRGNDRFGEVSGGKTVYYAAKNAVAGYSGGGMFEPKNEVKGDVARIVMYVYAHYNTAENVGGTTNGSGGKFGTLKFTNVMGATNEDEAISLLLKWNKLDPVDESEVIRNDAVQEIQGNRNPFIDNESYADAIWGNGTVNPDPDGPTTVEPTSITLNPSTLNLSVGASQSISVSTIPTNASKSVSWTSSDSSVATVSGGTVKAVKEGTATITATSTLNSSVKQSATVTVTKATVPDSASSVTIDINSFSLSSGYGFKSWSSGGISGTAYIYGDNSSSMQFNTNNRPSYYLASTTPSSTPITSVTVTLNSSTNGNKDWKLLTSTSAYGQLSSGNPENGNDREKKSVTTSGTTWTVDGNDTYFALVYAGSGACYLDSVVLTFAKAGGGGAENPPVDTPTELQSLSINHSKYDMGKGDTVKLSVTPNPANASAEVNWTSSSPSVASVSADGTVTANRAGTAVITATSKVNSSIKVTCTITVTEPPVQLESLTMHPEEYGLKVGGSVQLFVTGKPVGADTGVTWTSSDSSVASVESSGKVTAIAEGTATITATSKVNSSVTAVCEITVTKADGGSDTPAVEIESIKISPSSLTLTEGGHIKLNPAVRPAEAKSDVIWSSSDTSVAQVAQDGTVIAVSAGTATVTASSKTNPEIKAEVKVTVEAEVVEELPNETLLAAFRDAVASIPSDGSLSSRFSAINSAIKAYKDLTELEIAAATDDIEALKAAIVKYNQDIAAYNDLAESADKGAVNGILR